MAPSLWFKPFLVYKTSLYSKIEDSPTHTHTLEINTKKFSKRENTQAHTLLACEQCSHHMPTTSGKPVHTRDNKNETNSILVYNKTTFDLTDSMTKL